MFIKIFCLSFLILFAITSNAIAQNVEICMAMDGSGSISTSDFQLQIDGEAAAIGDPTVVPRNSTVAIAVVQFSSSAQVEVSRTVIDSDSTATNLATQIRAISKLGGGTNIGSAIALCSQQFTYAPGWKQVIDVSTDGVSSGNPSVDSDNAVSAGVDAINAVGVGSGIDINQLNDLVRPQPPSTMGAGDGFVVTVADFNEYVNTIKAKIKIEITGGGKEVQVPTVTEWGMIIFMILAGLGAMYSLRRKRAN